MSTLDQLQQQVEQLAQQVADLQAQQVDQLTPNYLTIDPATGKVSANFKGVIEAEGVILPTWLSPAPQTDSEIVWNNPSTGAVDGLIHMDRASDENVGYFSVVGEPGDARIDAEVFAQDSTKAQVAALYLTAAGTGDEVKAQAGTGPGGQLITVIASNGASSFIQTNGGPINATLCFGGTYVSFPGGSSISNVTTVGPLGLPNKDVQTIVATPIGGVQPLSWACNATAPGTIEIQCDFVSGYQPAAGATVEFNWIAIF